MSAAEPPVVGTNADVKLTAVSSFCMLCFLLISGKVIRMKIPLFQKLYLPSSIIGGGFGIVIKQLVGLDHYVGLGSDPSLFYATYLTAGWKALPEFLINVVFCAVFIGVSLPSPKMVWKEAGPQLMYGQILAWGMYASALVAAILMGLVINLPSDLFGTIVPIGFEGGHGTAAGLKSTYEKMGWAAGSDFGLASATIGMVGGLLMSLVLINIGMRLGWMDPPALEKKDSFFRAGIYRPDERPAAGFQTVMSDSIDSLALHLTVVGMGIGIGYVIKRGLLLIEENVVFLQAYSVLESFPLFALCMVGGCIVQLFMDTFTKGIYIDHSLMQRLSGTALDFLVVAAIAEVELASIKASLGPFFVMMIVGLGWHLVCMLVIAPHVLPDYPFERGIAQLGHSTGTTATGLLLLKMVDPEATTPVQTAFAYMLLMHEPFMSGGLYTSLPLPIIHKIPAPWGPIAMLGVCIIICLVWYFLYWVYFRRTYPNGPAGRISWRKTHMNDVNQNARAARLSMSGVSDTYSTLLDEPLMPTA